MLGSVLSVFRWRRQCPRGAGLPLACNLSAAHTGTVLLFLAFCLFFRFKNRNVWGTLSDRKYLGIFLLKAKKNFSHLLLLEGAFEISVSEELGEGKMTRQS